MDRRFLVILDGPADEPLAELDARTPLQAARTPNLDNMARRGRIGRALRVDRFDRPRRGADAWWALLGGREPATLLPGPLVASALEVPLTERDLALRAALAVRDERTFLGVARETADDARALWEALRPLESRRLAFFVAPDGQAAVRWTDAALLTLGTTAPDTAVGQPWDGCAPQGDGAERLTRWMDDAREILERHPLTRRRREEGKPAATGLWLWGAGPELRLPGERFDEPVCAVASDTELVGLARAAGWPLRWLPRAADPEWACRARVDAALAAVDRGAVELVVHLWCGGADLDARLRAIEAMDRELIGGLGDGCIRRELGLSLTVVWNAPEPAEVMLAAVYDSRREGDRNLPFDARGREETAWETPAAGLRKLVATLSPG